jgi:hypothetical protein
MIKGSTKGKFVTATNHLFKCILTHSLVGEIFYCGKDSEGKLLCLPQYLGQPITGLGGGSGQMFVIEGKKKTRPN